MRYFRVFWIHRQPDIPVEIVVECDESRYETRKVEIFLDGGVYWATGTESTGDTRLGDQPYPPDEEILAMEEFRFAEISRDEFESVWKRTRQPQKQVA